MMALESNLLLVQQLAVNHPGRDAHACWLALVIRFDTPIDSNISIQHISPLDCVVKALSGHLGFLGFSGHG